MAALAICAVTAALLRRRTGTAAPAPVLPDQPPPADPGMIPLTVPETGRLLAQPAPTRQRRALAGLAPPPPSPVTLVPPANTTRPRVRDHPGQLANGCCRTREHSPLRRVRGVAGRRVISACGEDGWTWPSVAWCRWPLALGLLFGFGSRMPRCTVPRRTGPRSASAATACLTGQWRWSPPAPGGGRRVLRLCPPADVVRELYSAR